MVSNESWVYSGHILSNKNVAKHLSSKGDIIQEIGGVQYFSFCLRMVININEKNSPHDVYFVVFVIYLECYFIFFLIKNWPISFAKG